MSDLAQLLDVQQHDTLADQLRHRRANLPEADELSSALSRFTAIDRKQAAIATQRDGLLANQNRLESEISSARERVGTIEVKMYGGGVTNAREAQALQDEIASLGRRASMLEDEEIEIMEQLEPLDAAVKQNDTDLAQVVSEIDRLEMAITTAQAEIDVELLNNEAERGNAMESVPETLAAEYEKIRSTSGGVAVAQLVGGQCGGCHIRLAAMELDRVKHLPPDALVHCEECGRLLVR